MDLKISSYASTRSRRSHRKSRLGCSNCKRRRVKCDETEPACQNCIRHSIECSYSQELAKRNTSASASTPEKPPPPTKYSFISSSQSDFAIPKRGQSDTETTLSSPSSSVSESAVANRPFQFTSTDMALFHHLFAAEDLKPHIPDQLVRLGFSTQYVLRLLLAVSGFHLKRKAAEASNLHFFLGPEVDFSAEAERHLAIAIADVAATDPRLHQGNSHALYVASLFIFICSLARGPQSGEYLAFRDDSDMPCLSLFNGVRSILEATNNLGISGGISEVQPGGGQEREIEQDQNQGDPSYNVPPQIFNPSNAVYDHSESLQQLCNLIYTTFPTGDPHHSSYCHALDSLCVRYDAILGARALPGSELWPQIFSWLYLLPDIVVHDMQQRHGVALVLFSFFAVLLNELDSVWFIHQWPRHIAQGVYRSVDDYHQTFLFWPLRRLQLL